MSDFIDFTIAFGLLLLLALGGVRAFVSVEENSQREEAQLIHEMGEENYCLANHALTDSRYLPAICLKHFQK